MSRSGKKIFIYCAYGSEKDKFNTVTFDPVKTTAIKIEITLPKDWSSGVQEVIME